MRADEILKINGFEIIQYCEKDGDIFKRDYLAFEADAFDCIRASQILEKENFQIFDCYLKLNTVDGILEKPYGVVTIV